jgi:hypothetical protein
MGDVGHIAKRGSPLFELETACGAPGAIMPTEQLRRDPYLQQVTTSSAILGWVAGTSEPQSVEVTAPDGRVVVTSAAAVDAAASPSPGDNQMWASVQGLEPDSLYCYRVFFGDQPISERVGFRTAPTAESTRKIGVLAFGDSGAGGGDQYSLRSQMEEVQYELIVHTGDIAYEDGTFEQFQANVFDVYTDLMRHVPFFPSPGNHEYGTQNGAPYRAVFNLPVNEKWYSYDWGRIHFAVLDTEADYETQIRWLDEDLSASKLPWKIVFMHRPPYSSGHHGSDTRLRKLLAPVLERHHVQLVLAGHDHHYERIEPQNGVTYVVTGGGGRGTYDVGESSFTAFSESVIHYVYLEVGVDELVLHAIDASGKQFDSVVIPRG